MRATILFIILTLSIFSCDKQLSKEQRKALKDEMELREIKKISEEDIYKKTLEQGNLIFSHLQDSAKQDSISTNCQCEILFSTSSNGLGEKSKAIFQAYVYDPSGEENIQKEQDKLIYSKPQIANDSLTGVWFITFQKREIIKLL